MENAPATKPKSPREPLWPKVKPWSVGKYHYWLLDYTLHGKRTRETFDTKEKALNAAAGVRARRDREGAEGFSLEPAARAEAAACVEKLAPHGASLTAAVDYYVKHVLNFKEAPEIEKAIEQMLSAKEAAGKRPRTIEDLRHRLNKFAANFPGRKPATISTEEIESWLTQDKDWSARTKINFGIKITEFFNFAKARGWTDGNPMDGVTRPSATQKEPEILTLTESLNLLKNAGKVGLLGYVALGLLQGVRAAELARLKWESINFTERTIALSGEITKRRQRRILEINPAALAWLSPLRKKKGPVLTFTPDVFRKKLKKLCQLAKIPKWKPNCLRHTFASMHVAAYGDAMATARALGHAGNPTVLFDHYRALVPKPEAELFWKLRPGTPSNVIAFRQPKKKIATESQTAKALVAL